MPIFEYECADCGHRFELLVRAGTKLACPLCGASRLKKQLSTFAAMGSAGKLPACADKGCDLPARESAACKAGACPFASP